MGFFCFCFCFLFGSITLFYLPALLAGLITLENIILCKIVFIWNESSFYSNPVSGWRQEFISLEIHIPKKCDLWRQGMYLIFCFQYLAKSLEYNRFSHFKSLLVRQIHVNEIKGNYYVFNTCLPNEYWPWNSKTI